MDIEGKSGVADVAAEMAWVRHLAVALAADAHAGEDIAQEALLAAAQAGPRHVRDLRSWLGGVVRHLALHTRRSDARRAVRERDVSRDERVDDSTLALERLEIQEALSRAVRELPEPYRSTVLLRWFDELQPKEIARQLGVPVRTVHTRISRALSLLRQELDRQSHGDRSRWLNAWIPLLPGPSSKPGLLSVKTTLVGLALILCVTSILITLGGSPEVVLWMDQYGSIYRKTTLNYPRDWIFASRPDEQTYNEAQHSDGSWVKEGPYTRWSRDGNKLEEGNCHDGKRHGRWTYWKDDGTIDKSRTGAYENDVKVSD